MLTIDYDQLDVRAGRRRVLDSFTWRATAARTADWYAETLDRTTARRKAGGC